MGKVSGYVVDRSYSMDIDCVIVGMVIVYNVYWVDVR